MKKIFFIMLALIAITGTAVAETKPQNVAANPHASQLINRGIVLDVIESTMYTYLQVSSDTGTIWIAAYRNDIAKGDTVSYSNGVVMKNFVSKSLNRTFDKIIFVDAVVPVKK
jgi:hypothetical protein